MTFKSNSFKSITALDHFHHTDSTLLPDEPKRNWPTASTVKSKSVLEIAENHSIPFTELGLQRHYDSDAVSGLIDIYQAIVGNAQTYWRFTGYFSSSIYAALEFLAGDGWRQPEKKIRIVCSPKLSAQDIEAISAGYSIREAIKDGLVHEIEQLWSGSYESNVGIKALSSLIACGQLDIKIATPKSGEGLYHSKVGIAEDFSGNWLVFHGSANETFQGMLLNWETLDLRFSWSSEDDSSDIAHWRNRFISAWSNELERFEVTDFPEVAQAKLLQLSNEDPSQVSDEIARFINRARPSIKPSFIDLPELFWYQKDVLSSWDRNSNRGIVDHVTGAGKTITALSAIRDHCKNGLPALVLVPRDGLQRQWISELSQYFGETLSVLAVGGSDGGSPEVWSRAISRQTSPDRGLGGRVTVAVIKSASGIEFAKRVRAGNHLLVVADEVHNMGSPTARMILEILQPCQLRLGLSATYQRANDEEGTNAIERFFGNVLEPRFGIREAIENKRLVPYHYDFEVCHLDDDENSRLASLTRRIISLSGKDDSESLASMKILLSKRAKVVKSAKAKVNLAKDILLKHYSAEDRWLIYCDDKAQMEGVFQSLTNEGLPCAMYFADMTGSKAETLDYLSIPGKIVISIKCLDEGINIPEVDNALILASSTNPREYIQRRGRVLRRSATKTRAKIIDVLVLDELQGPAISSEVKRMIAFMEDALNDAPRVKLLRYLTGDLLQDFIDDFEEGVDNESI